MGQMPPGLPRTHTKIVDGAACDQALFTTIARSVQKPDGSDRTWLIDVDLGQVSSDLKPAALALVAVLLNDGLDAIGKTGAHAYFERVIGATSAKPQPIHGRPHHYAVMLTVPAMMLDPARLWDSEGRWGQEPDAAYAAYWSFALPGTTLHGFYATQSLSGGYIARRRRLYGADSYFPFLLTDPGSIFEIETENDQCLADLCRFGLPVVPLEKTRRPVDWKTCPYLPENGYGRIVADHLSSPTQSELTRRVRDV